MGKPELARNPSDIKCKSKFGEPTSGKVNPKDKASDKLPAVCGPANHPSLWIVLTLLSLITLIFFAGFPWQGMMEMGNAGTSQTTCSTSDNKNPVHTSITTRRYREIDVETRASDADQEDKRVEQHTSHDCKRSSHRKRTASLGTGLCGNGDRCSTSSQCVDGADGYTCVCDEDYYGTYCDAVLADCERLRCNNHGECRKKLGTQEIYCTCSEGYNSDNCEIEPADAPCSSITAPCSSRGTCIDRADGSYICLCNDGYNGTSCEYEVDECSSNPCIYGNCTDIVNGFYCDCESGYEGVQCQNDKDDCTGSPCGSNGTCLDLFNSHVCICNTGYTGADCHSICDNEPCFNNATCSLCEGGVCNGTGLSFRCTCTENATYGVLCTDKDGFWSQWSEWMETPMTAVYRLETGKFSAPETNCSYINRTRTRECMHRLANGLECEGSDFEEEIIDAECECLLCCEHSLFCGHFDITVCFCNVNCALDNSDICCKSNTHVCNTTTPILQDDLF